MSESEQAAPAGSAAMAQILPAVAWLQSKPVPVVFTPPTTEEKEREVRILTARNDQLQETQKKNGEKVAELQKNYVQAAQARDQAFFQFLNQHIRSDIESGIADSSIIASAAAIDIGTDDLDKARAQFHTARLATREARRAFEDAQIAANANRASATQERMNNQARMNRLSVEVAQEHIRQGRGTEAEYRKVFPFRQAAQQLRRPKY